MQVTLNNCRGSLFVLGVWLAESTVERLPHFCWAAIIAKYTCAFTRVLFRLFKMLPPCLRSENHVRALFASTD